MPAAAFGLTIGGGGDGRDVNLSQTYDVAASAASTAPTYIVARGKPKGIAKDANDYRNQLVADLKAAGIEVLDDEALAALPSYQKLAEKMTTDAFEAVDSYELGKGTWANNQVTVFSRSQVPCVASKNVRWCWSVPPI